MYIYLYVLYILIYVYIYVLYMYIHKYIYQQKNDTQMCSFYKTSLKKIKNEYKCGRISGPELFSSFNMRETTRAAVFLWYDFNRVISLLGNRIPLIHDRVHRPWLTKNDVSHSFKNTGSLFLGTDRLLEEESRGNLGRLSKCYPLTVRNQSLERQWST